MDDGNKKIAIVDDEISYLNLFGDALRGEGFRIVKFSSPKEAMAKIVEEKPDIVLLDIAMPEVTGLDVFEHLKNDLKGKMPKVVFLTNLSETVGGVRIDDNFAKSLGADGYIPKSDNLESILKSVKDILGKK